jgi:hypothetical protein
LVSGIKGKKRLEVVESGILQSILDLRRMKLEEGGKNMLAPLLMSCAKYTQNDIIWENEKIVVCSSYWKDGKWVQDFGRDIERRM